MAAEPLYKFWIFHLNGDIKMTSNKRPIWVWVTAIVAVIFGVMTLKSGGSVIFFDGEARQAAGNYINFVVWFNFIAGFFYIATGTGIWLQKSWALTTAIIIASLTLLVFAAFGIHIYNGGEYEQRTIVAMSLRSFIWMVIAIKAYRVILATHQL